MYWAHECKHESSTLTAVITVLHCLASKSKGCGTKLKAGTRKYKQTQGKNKMTLQSSREKTLSKYKQKRRIFTQKWTKSEQWCGQENRKRKNRKPHNEMRYKNSDEYEKMRKVNWKRQAKSTVYSCNQAWDAWKIKQLKHFSKTKSKKSNNKSCHNTKTVVSIKVEPCNWQLQFKEDVKVDEWLHKSWAWGSSFSRHDFDMAKTNMGKGGCLFM